MPAKKKEDEMFVPGIERHELAVTKETVTYQDYFFYLVLMNLTLETK